MAQSHSSHKIETFKMIDAKLILSRIQESLTHLTSLNQKSRLSEIEKKVFIRNFTQLGEALTYFRISEDFLKPVQLLKDQKSTYSLVEGFTYHRNKLLHEYMFEHLKGKDDLYLNAKDFLNNNIEQFTKALIQIKNQPISGMPETFSKIQNEASHDLTIKLLDHCFYAIQSIDEFYSILASENIFLNTPNDVNKLIKENLSNELMRNFLEISVIEIATHLKEFNFQWNKDKIFLRQLNDPLREPEEQTKKIALDSLSTIGKLRNDAVHDTNAIPKKKLSQTIINFMELKRNYLPKMKEALEKSSEYSYNEKIQTFLKNSNAAENPKLAPDRKEEPPALTDNKSVGQTKRNSQDLTSYNSDISSKKRDTRTKARLEPRDASWINFEMKHPEVTSQISRSAKPSQISTSTDSALPNKNEDNVLPRSPKR